MSQQNIYDNKIFFKGYQEMRNENNLSANELIEIPQLFSLIGDVKGKKVLNLGCGAGGHDRKLIELGAESVLGIDLSENMIKEAIKDNTSNKIRYKVLSMSDIDSLNEKFDLVISSLAIHYVEDYDGLCKKVANILNDGGEFTFSIGHPMDSCTILDNYDNDYIIINDKKYRLLSDYNNEGKRFSNWFIDGVETYHRNISHLANGLINAGLTIIKMEESTASENAIKLKPKLIEQKDHSYFLYFKTKKEKH